MSRKRTQEEAIAKMQELEPNYDFSKFVYKNNRTKSPIICDKGHHYEACYSKFVDSGRRCPKCKGRDRTTEEVREIMNNLQPNYDFSKFVYKNSNSKSIIICNKGHQYEASFSVFTYGHRCPYCKAISCSERTLKSEEEVLKELQLLEPNYDFSKFKYVKSDVKSIIICNKGHTYESTYTNFKQGKRCPYCAGMYKTKESVRKELQLLEPNYDFSKFDYTRSIDKSIIICDKEHQFDMNYNDFKKGARCPECAREKRGLKRRLSQNKALEDMIKVEPTYDFSKFIYKTAKNKSIVICDKGHQFEVSYDSFYRAGSRCPYCNNNHSSPEYIIIEFIKSFYDGEVIHGSRKTIINPLTNYYMELDIYLPEIKLAIEFNGRYWHSDEIIVKRHKGKFKSAEEYHNCKTKACEKIGVELIHIFEEDYKKSKEKIFEYIKKSIEGRI